MKNKYIKHNQSVKDGVPHPERPRFSPAIMEIARKSLKEFEIQSDKSFLARAEMDRNLRSL